VFLRAKVAPIAIFSTIFTVSAMSEAFMGQIKTSRKNNVVDILLLPIGNSLGLRYSAFRTGHTPEKFFSAFIISLSETKIAKKAD